MFTKLLKHEWRATRGMLGTLCLICLGASLLGGGTMRYLMIASSQDDQQNVIVVLNVLAMVWVFPMTWLAIYVRLCQ